MNRKFLFRFILITLLLLWGCNCHKSPTEPTPEEQGNYIRGKVILENQTNHASCIVFLDSLFIGTATDSSGYFEILLPDSLATLSGTFGIYYYIFSFKPEKVTIELDSGSVVPGVQAADSTGTIKTVLLNQLLRMNVTTDKETYSLAGDVIGIWVEIFNTWHETIGYYLWEQSASARCWFYKLDNGNLIQYLRSPIGIGIFELIEPGQSRTEDGGLGFPFRHNSYYNDNLTPGEYIFMPILNLYWPYGNEDGVMDRYVSFIRHQDCSTLGKGFVTNYPKSLVYNALDSKDIEFPKIRITE